MSNHYTTLGVESSATQADIKKQYRKLASVHHPDRGGDTAKFQELQTAYATLSDVKKRAEYDNPTPHNQGMNFSQNGMNGMPPGFEEVFSQFGDIFGRRPTHKAPPRNRTIVIQTIITLEDAFAGKELLASFTLPNGKNQELEVKIPAGIDDGVTLRIAEMGDDSVPDVPRGDIHLVVHIRQHDIFQRNGSDLIKVVDISCIDAMLGKTIEVTTLDNKILELSIAPGTQYGQILAAAGYGMPHSANINVRGRLLMQLNITVPTDLTDKQKEILNNFNE